MGRRPGHRQSVRRLGRPVRAGWGDPATRLGIGDGALAKAVFPRRLGQPSDPLSGFFALRLGAVDLDRLDPDGFKILLEILVRNPRLAMAEVPFTMSPRRVGRSKASVREGLRFARLLSRLRLGVLAVQVRRSVTASPGSWLLRALAFGLVGLSGLVVNSAVFWLLIRHDMAVHYLLAAALSTEASTSWLFGLTETLVFRGPKPGRLRSRAMRFFLLNHVALVARLPLLALLVDGFGTDALAANVATLALLFVVRFVLADAVIYGRGEVGGPAMSAAPVRQPIRVVVDLAPATVPPRAPAVVPGPQPSRYLPYRYAIPGVASVGSQVPLPELEFFRAQWLDNDTEIQLRVGRLDGGMRRRVTVTTSANPPRFSYTEQLGRLAANFRIDLGSPIQVLVAPSLARSPHVVYTNILEALLRFVAVSRGVMLLHSACVEINGVGVLISARTDTGKTGTVLRLVREHGARFLSDDMTLLHPDGRVDSFPKPLTISHHTLLAVQSDELTDREWRRLRLQSRLHSRQGRQFAMVLSQLNLPIMGVNALTQRLVPPPKFAVDHILPCQVIDTTTVSELFVIERGEAGTAELSLEKAMATLLANTEDAYQFPPFRQLAPAIVIGEDDHLELRRKEQEILAAALTRIRAQRLTSSDFGWADEIPRLIATRAGTRSVGPEASSPLALLPLRNGHPVSVPIVAPMLDAAPASPVSDGRNGSVV